ncbi:MAG TPA: ABC transporter permease [Acidobacteriota bacterium]|nr:ABC transporter permease [Acidobacteriota bacterium]
MILIKHARLAVKSLRERSIRSWITILGIVVSIAVILVLFTLSSGLQQAVVALFEDFGTNRIFIMNGDGGFAGLTSVGLLEKDVDVIESIPEFDLVIPFLIESAQQVEYKNKIVYASIYGTPNENVDDIVRQYKYDRDITVGTFFDEGERNVAILGYNVANNVNDEWFGKQIDLKNSITIAGHKFEVIGIFKRFGSDDDNAITIPLEDARLIFNKTSEVTAIDAILVDGADMTLVAEKLDRLLERTKGEDQYTILTPEAVLRQFNTIIFIVQGVLLAIASISLFVGAIGIANTMFTSVLEREKEIGIMKSVGARNSDILALFVIESGLIGMIGGLVGVVIGIGISFAVGAIASAAGFTLLTISISPVTVIGCLLFAFVVGMVSGFIPSYLGSRKKIIDTLRDS